MALKREATIVGSARTPRFGESLGYLWSIRFMIAPLIAPANELDIVTKAAGDGLDIVTADKINDPPLEDGVKMGLYPRDTQHWVHIGNSVVTVFTVSGSYPVRMPKEGNGAFDRIVPDPAIEDGIRTRVLSFAGRVAAVADKICPIEEAVVSIGRPRFETIDWPPTQS